MPEPRGGDVDETELERMRNYARAAREHPTWSVAYAQDVPKLAAEVEQWREATKVWQSVSDKNFAAWNKVQHRLRFCEMVLDRNAVTFDGLPWREAARLREAADGIDEPETEPVADA